MDATRQLVSRLIGNGFRFQYLKKTGKPGRPQALSLEITHRCIARCVMCNIWRIPEDVPDLSLQECLHLLQSDLFSDLVELDITGGEPFLRTDLPDFFSGICDLRLKRLKSLRSIAVTTNGLLTDRVPAYTERILEMLDRARLDLVVVCAMDAIGEIHDRIRNYRDAWTKVNRTIDALVGLRERFPNLIIGLKTTVLPVNVGELEKISAYAGSRGLFTIISPYIITKGRYLNPDRAADLAFSRADLDTMIQFFRGEGFRWGYHAERLADYLTTGVMKKPCSCGFNYFFVRSSGELFLCPLIDESIGNIREVPVKNLFASEKATALRKRIGSRPECRCCTEPGLERYSLPYEGFTYLSLLFKMGRERFLEMHRHMGLDKYLDGVSDS
jgi:MoaA/NifB/PqqE/SkfB family radical SAM enzyme